MNRVIEGYRNKLKNLYYGLLREKEENGEWEKFLDQILIELLGLPEEERTINYYRLVAKTSSLKYLRFFYFRKTIFECMTLINSLRDEET